MKRSTAKLLFFLSLLFKIENVDMNQPRRAAMKKHPPVSI
jgi:hypothetical protein